MALKQLNRRLLLGLGLIALVGCGQGVGNADKFVPVAPPRRPGVATVAVLMPESSHVRPVWEALRDELADDFNVVPVIVHDDGDRAIENALDREKPNCVVLMDNKILRRYRGFQKRRSGGKFAPAVVLLTSFLEELQGSIENGTGIAYEVPAITSFSLLRSLLSVRLERVGVVYRRGFSNYVRRQSRLAEIEKITLIQAEVPNDPSVDDLIEALERLSDRDKVDGLWVLNDNALLSPEMMRDGWLPFLKDRVLPTVVGVEGLVTAEIRFGTMAVSPALEPLGVQAATMIFDIADNDWQIMGAVEQPLSTRTVLDIKRARQDFGFREASIGQIARIVE